MTRRKQKSCHQCRSRHLKCDGQQPCMHCRRGGRDCSKDENHIFLNESNIGIVRRRHRYNLSFEDGQTWMNLPSSVRFANTTNSLTSSADSPETTTSARQGEGVDGPRSCSPAQWPSANDSSRQPERSLSAALDFAIDITQSLEDFLASSNVQSPNDTRFCAGSLHASPTGHEHRSYRTDDAPPLTEAPVLWPDKIQWPFTTCQEALLMRHYVNRIAPWWDVIDGGAHFTTTIPQLAATSPALLYAIFALSARHLSLVGKLDEAICFRYTDASYQVLLPDLQAKAYEPENLAAVLCLCQVISLTTRPCEGYNFRLGLDIFLSAWRANAASSLHAELFFSVLRLHFHYAFYNGETLDEVESDCEWMWTSLSQSAGDSRLWACRVKLHAARCLNYFSNRNGRTWERWIALKYFSDTWSISKPGYYNPVFQQDSNEGDPFPTQLFASPLFAGTHQFFSIARLLLINNQPQSVPPPELDILPFSQKEVEQQSRIILRRVMGTAISHMDSIPVVLASTMPITYCGHLLTTDRTQQHAHDILQLAQKNAPGTVPPNEFVRLRKVWGWDEEVLFQNVL